MWFYNKHNGMSSIKIIDFQVNVHKSPQRGAILSQMNLVHTITQTFCLTHLIMSKCLILEL